MPIRAHGGFKVPSRTPPLALPRLQKSEEETVGGYCANDEFSRGGISAGSGHEYLGCYALPLLRTNAHILRLPFEL